jgi:integrase
MSRGHVRRRGSRSWELKFDIDADPLTGRRRIRYASFKGTKREAEQELARLIAQEAAGEGIDPAKTTLGEFLDRWETGWAELNVSGKTLERYSELLRHHVRPHLGHVRIQKLRPVMLADLYAKLVRETGLAARTVGHVHRVTRRALGHAKQWSVIPQNPADNVSPPPVQSDEIRILRSDDVQAVLAKLRERRGRLLYTVAIVVLATGVRRGELCTALEQCRLGCWQALYRACARTDAPAWPAIQGSENKAWTAQRYPAAGGRDGIARPLEGTTGNAAQARAG